MIRILIFGTFDGLHPGHLDLIRQAREHGNHLTVVVARDETVQQVKNKSPKHTEQERLATLKATSGVDNALLGNLDNKYSVILEHKPNIIVLGYDQVAFTENLQAFLYQHNLPTKIIRAKPFHPEKYKSSFLRKQR